MPCFFKGIVHTKIKLHPFPTLHYVDGGKFSNPHPLSAVLVQEGPGSSWDSLVENGRAPNIILLVHQSVWILEPCSVQAMFFLFFSAHSSSCSTQHLPTLVWMCVFFVFFGGKTSTQCQFIELKNRWYDTMFSPKISIVAPKTGATFVLACIPFKNSRTQHSW